DAGPLGRAVAQEFQRPGPQARIEARLEAQRLAVVEERAPENTGRPRRGPGVGMAGRDEPGIAEARLGGGLGEALDHRHLVPVPGELIGGGDADDPGSEDDRAHAGDGQIAAVTPISTLKRGAASFASTVARAGVLPFSTQASQTLFISSKVAMSESQILAESSFDLS